MSGNHQKTRIQCLQIAAHVPDPLTARLRLERALLASDLIPAGVPPSSILCVRRLRSAHRAIRSVAAGFENPALMMEWEQSVRERLTQLADNATHPIREIVPANAESVIFSDRAEMLACLALDWCNGQAGLRWWWRSLLPHSTDLQSVLAAWMQSPEYIPAAWQHLAKSGKAARFANHFSAEQSRQMLNAIVRRFALVELQVALDHSVHTADSLAESRGKFQKTSSPAKFSSQIAPWEAWAAENREEWLLPDQKLLMGIALTLQRAPAIARTREFARAVARFEAASKERRSSVAAETNLQWATDATRTTAAAPLLRSGTDADTSRQIFQTANIETVSAGKNLTGTESHTYSDDSPVLMRAENQEQGTQVSASDQGTAENSIAQVSLVDESVAVPLSQVIINTDYGGLFYLLNLGLFLELYGDITTPWVRDIPLGIWDFLALFGERLIGKALRRDPVWGLLARLAGRDEQAMPASDCAMPDEWRLPAGWLKAFELNDDWQWAVNDGRLLVWHPFGFLVLDVPLVGDEVEIQLGREMHKYAEFAPRAVIVAPLGHRVRAIRADEPLNRWMDWLALYTRARLQRALDIDDAIEVGRALCKSHAKVFVTSTHLDVVFSLAELMVEVRLAGLDRDPGWIPAAGRIIRFHYE